MIDGWMDDRDKTILFIGIFLNPVSLVRYL